MKMPKIIKRYCPFCKKHTEQRVAIVKTGKRGSLSWGSIVRARKRGQGGTGNLGRWGSKPALSQWKRVGKKTTKKFDIRYECKECKKKHTQSQGFKIKKLDLI